MQGLGKEIDRGTVKLIFMVIFWRTQMTVFRTVEKLSKKKTWVHIAFEKLKPKDTFRMFENDETPVKDKKGDTEFIASSIPISCKPEGNFMIDCE